jgi:chaperonin GroES
MFKPGSDKVVVRKPVAKTTTAGGLEIPDEQRERPDESPVLYLGDGAVQYKVGQIVVYPKWTGFDIKIGVEDCIIMFESEIWGGY